MPDRSPRTDGRWSYALRLHLPFLVAASGCLFAGWFELTRALAGRQVAWVYAFEWPLFAILGTYIWWRLWHESPPRLVISEEPNAIDRADPGLVAWQQYLAELQAADPPGGPPDQAPDLLSPADDASAKGAVNARWQGPDSRRRPPEKEG